MTTLIGWEEKAPPNVKVGDEVCFARHMKPRDEDAVRQLTLSWEELGRPIMFMVYGKVAGDPVLVDDSTRPTTWLVRIDVWQATTFQPQGFASAAHFGDWDADDRDDEGLEVKFEFNFDEPLTVVRHDATPV